MLERLSDNKIVGYLLLFCGLAIIAYSVLDVLSVFRGRKEPFGLFDSPGISIDLGKLANPPAQNKEFQQELVAPELINKPLNLIAHLTLMSFIAGAGFKIAQLGILLIRPVKVNLIGKMQDNTSGNNQATRSFNAE